MLGQKLDQQLKIAAYSTIGGKTQHPLNSISFDRVMLLTHRVLRRESVPGGHPHGLVLFHHGVVANVVRRERAVVGVNLEEKSTRNSQVISSQR